MLKCFLRAFGVRTDPQTAALIHIILFCPWMCSGSPTCPDQDLPQFVFTCGTRYEALRQPRLHPRVAVVTAQLFVWQVSGEEALKKTSLKSLGLTGGSAIIRYAVCPQPH